VALSGVRSRSHFSPGFPCGPLRCGDHSRVLRFQPPPHRVKSTAGEVPLAGSFSVGLFPNRACEFPRTLLSSDHDTEDLAQVTLMSDGVSVYECASADEVVDLLQGGQGVFGIALGRVWREVEGDLAVLPAVRAEDGLVAVDSGTTVPAGDGESPRNRMTR